MQIDNQAVERLAAAVRGLSVDAVERAKSGHPGMPMGAADYAAVLWAYFLRFDPQHPEWPLRDKFVLSAGHGSMLLYSLLHLFGFDLPLDELKNFRQWGSRTPGHPEFGVTPGVETSTGPLGQGLANGVGLALAAKMMANRCGSPLFTSRVFGICSDGDLMEGVSAEAASLAGHLRLDNLVFFYDDNGISIGGSTGVTFTEDVAARFAAYGWFVQHIDGHDPKQIAAALEIALGQHERPSLICAKTVIGKFAPHKAGTAESHGAPLGAAEARAAKEAMGLPADESFFISPEVYAFCADRVARKREENEQRNASYLDWRAGAQSLASAFDAQCERRIPDALRAELVQTLAQAPADATRNLSGKALQILAKHVPWLVGGSADLEPSTKTLIEGAADVMPPEFAGRNIRFGVREHAMGAIANGLAYTRQWVPYTATFLVFADYMRPAVRLAALARLQTLFLFTHDSFYVGEDGPTHEPIEQINSLRMIPDLYVFRPADGYEIALCYWQALQMKRAPSVLLFSRQKVPVLARDPKSAEEDVLRGAYVVSGAEVQDRVVIATGSEVSLAVEAAARCAQAGKPLRVVSMPCVELFRKQKAEFCDRIIPPGARKVSLEAGSTFGWERIVGSGGLTLGWDEFGASAPAEVLAEKFGFTAASVAERILSWLENS